MRTVFVSLSISALGFLWGCSGREPAAEPPEPAIETERAEAVPASAAENAEIHAAERSFTIVMLGDSLTAGFGLPQSEALPEQVERLLTAQSFDVDIVNAGVSGDTSAGGLARFDWSVASADPDLLIIALGANDFLSGLDPDETRANLAAIIERGQASGAEILLVSLSARSSTANDPRAAEFAAIYPELAGVYGLPLHEGLVAPIFDKPELLLPDGLHPTAEGVSIIAVPLAATLRELIPAGPGD